MARIEDISRDKLASDKRLEIKVKEAIHSELMQEIEKWVKGIRLTLLTLLSKRFQQVSDDPNSGFGIRHSKR